MPAQTFERQAYRGRMVGKVIVDADSAPLAAQFHASFDVAETVQCLDSDRRRHARMPRCGQCGERIGDVVLTGQRPVDPPDILDVADHVERTAVGGRVRGVPAGLERRIEMLHRRPASHVQHIVQVAVVQRRHDQAGRRHRANLVVELSLDRVEIVEDVRMVEFEIVHDQGARMVMHELRPLVEECRVVFVGLDDEERRLTGTCGHAEVLRHTADQETRRESRIFKDPCQHARCRRLAVRPRHRKHPTVLQQVLGQPLRTRHVAQPAVQHVLDRWIATRHGIANDHLIGWWIEVCRLITLHQDDACGLELRAHRRIDVCIRTGHFVPERARDQCDTAHEGAADAEDVDLHSVVHPHVDGAQSSHGSGGPSSHRFGEPDHRSGSCRTRQAGLTQPVEKHAR